MSKCHECAHFRDEPKFTFKSESGESVKVGSCRKNAPKPETTMLRADLDLKNLYFVCVVRWPMVFPEWESCGEFSNAGQT